MNPGTATVSAKELDKSEDATDYKPSIYNHFVERGDVVWCTNLRSKSLIRLNRKDFQRVKRILANADERAAPDAMQEELDNLEELKNKMIKWKFLVPKELKEIDLLKVKNRMARFAKDKGLTLIIAPTLRCNFGCAYCYVNRSAQKMTATVRSRVARFLDQKLLPGMKAKIVWTGGEPSLAMDVVEDLSQQFLESCEQKGCSYEASLITNGYLLNDRMIASLKRSNVKNLQISLDGGPDLHNKTRHLLNGKPTYDKIMQNVERACDQIAIYLRINVDGDNHHAVSGLIDDLVSRNLTDRVYIYFARVDEVNENSVGHHDSCLSARRYAEVETSLIRLALDKGFRLGKRLVEPNTAFCGANSVNCYVVDSEANLLKCYHGLGEADAHRIGEIGENGEEIVTDPSRLLNWLSWDPFESEECRSCKVLPICMGGCRDKIVSKMNIEEGCRSLRFSLDDTVEAFAGIALRKISATTDCAGCAVSAAVTCGVP